MDPDVIIMFQLHKGHFVGRDKLGVALSGEFNRKTLPPELELRINATWVEKKSNNSTLYNGTKFRLDSIIGSDSSEKVIFNLGITCYKDFIGTNWSPNVQLYQRKGTEQFRNSQAFLSDALGVGAFLETSDGHAVFLKRSPSCAEAPGLWDIPGGHPEPMAIVGKVPAEEIDISAMSPKDVVDEIFNSTLSEIVNEVNIPQESLTDPLLIGVVRNTTSAGRPSSEYYVRCCLTADEIRKLYEEGSQAEADESTGIMFLPVNSIKTLQVMNSDIWHHMAPSAKGCLMLYAASESENTK